MDLIVTGEDNVVSKALVKVMGLFYETEFVPINNSDEISQKAKSQPTGIIAIGDSNESKEVNNAMYYQMSSDINILKDTQWIYLPLDDSDADMPNKVSFPPDLISILKALSSPDYRIKSLSLEEKILANRGILIDKITIFKHNLQNKIPTCVKLCEKKREAYRKHGDFNRLKEEVRKFVENAESQRSYTFTINKGTEELISTFKGCGINLEKLYPDLKNRIDKTTRKITGFWGYFHSAEELEGLYRAMEDLSNHLDALREKLKTFKI